MTVIHEGKGTVQFWEDGKPYPAVNADGLHTVSTKEINTEISMSLPEDMLRGACPAALAKEVARLFEEHFQEVVKKAQSGL